MSGAMYIGNYERLKVWKKGIEIVEIIYQISKNFPADERFGLTIQMQRAAVSIPSNVAEGHDRGNTNEYRRFCQIALGSCAELGTQLIIAHRLGYVPQAEFLKIRDYINHESRMLMRLIKSLHSR